jgi:hypothetical protein
VVERGGFEPPKAAPADLQSAPFGHSGTSPTGKAQVGYVSLMCRNWSWRWDSNPQPADYKSAALPLSYASLPVNLHQAEGDQILTYKNYVIYKRLSRFFKKYSTKFFFPFPPFDKPGVQCHILLFIKYL